MKDIENSRKESPFLGLTGMGGGVNSLMWTGASVVNGLLWMVGEADRGQLDNNISEIGGGATSVDKSSPIQVGTENTWSKIGVGNVFAGATKTDGTMWSWGNQSRGGLGLNEGSALYRSSPCQIGGADNWSDIFIGRAMCLATRTNNTLWSWGYNSPGGQLGLNDETARSSPTQIPGTTWTQPRNGGNHIGASGCLRTDNSLWTWGDNEGGRLGHNNTTNYSSPRQLPGTWADFDVCGGDANINAMIGVKTNGELWTWGYSEDGALGLNEGDVTYSSPKQVGTDTTWATGAHSVAMGAGHSFGIKTDGSLWAWGRNTYAALGTPGNVARSSPIQVGTDTNWSQVHCKESSVAAIRTNGQLWVWGRNNRGQLGLGSASEPPGPRQYGTSQKYFTEVAVAAEFLGTIT